ncbi:MAG: IS4 family transposase [Gallionella sp.]|nr:IS4 family transposase [Gallionella sp.]
MHVLTILHRILSTSFPEIHAKRLASLLAAVEAVVTGSRLTLSDMGRGLSGPVAVKHNIKRIDRLLGNDSLHTEIPKLYEALVRQCLDGISMPLIVIDWSDLTPDRKWQLLRASVAIEGRSMTLYEEVHPQSCATSPSVHQMFLTQLATMLPTGCMPILITDAGFRGAWFRLVNRMGWHWIGRIRNRDMVSPANDDAWTGCKTLYTRATAKAKSLGQYNYVRNHPVPCRLVLIKHASQKRHKKSRLGKLVHSSRSLKNARAQREPWLLAVSPTLAHLSAQAVVSVYAQRMQIEESFRDLKSERFGLGFSANRSTQKNRLGVLLLVACLASFVLRLIGEVGKARQMGFQFQSNTRRSRPVLSVITLALQLVQHGMAAFPPREFRKALENLRYDHPVLQL